LPLDDFVAQSALTMQVVGMIGPHHQRFGVSTPYCSAIAATRLPALERFAFYDRAAARYDRRKPPAKTRLYGNILLKRRGPAVLPARAATVALNA
jgi:L-fucose mutarotase/ribose pyranase (RbsD/FucU family)